MKSDLKRLAIGLSGSYYDSMVMNSAMRLAQITSAMVDTYLIRPVPDDPQLLLASGFLGETFKTFFEQAEKTITAFDQTARATFDQSTQEFPQIPANYHNPLKDLSREFSTAVWATDLAILAHPSLVNLHYYKNAVLDAIADSARPVLLLPEENKPADLSHALFVWRDDTDHARALTAALPMLSLADRVTVASRRSEEDNATVSSVALQYLKAHGVQANDVAIDSDTSLTPKVIEKLCTEHQASLLVIGGGLQSDLIDSFVTGIERRASRKPNRAVLAIG